jgi:hypothetical protein
MDGSTRLGRRVADRQQSAASLNLPRRRDNRRTIASRNTTTLPQPTFGCIACWMLCGKLSRIDGP